MPSNECFGIEKFSTSLLIKLLINNIHNVLKMSYDTVDETTTLLFSAKKKYYIIFIKAAINLWVLSA